MTRKIFFRICPVSGCRAKSGFWLTDEEIKKDEKYYCQNCAKESKLSKWRIPEEKDDKIREEL